MAASELDLLAEIAQQEGGDLKSRERHLASLRQAIAENESGEALALLSELYPAVFVEAFDHIRAKLRSAPILTMPWPHMVLDGLYPEAFWQRLVRGIPGQEFFHSSKKKADLDLTDSFGAFRLMPVSKRAPWQFAIDVIVRLAIIPELVARWRAVLDRKYAELLGVDCSHFRFTALNSRLMRRFPPYHLKPHLDSSRLGLTCLTYLTGASDEDAALGTELFSGAPLPVEGASATTYAHRCGVSVEPVGTVAFRPNRMLVFANLPHAHHGTTVPDDPKYGDGRTIWQFHIAPFEDQYLSAIANGQDEKVAS